MKYDVKKKIYKLSIQDEGKNKQLRRTTTEGGEGGGRGGGGGGGGGGRNRRSRSIAKQTHIVVGKHASVFALREHTYPTLCLSVL